MTIFDELIRLHPTGGSYTPTGTVVPSRRGPHEVVVETSLPEGTRVGVFVERQFRGLARVGAGGLTTVEVQLPSGNVEVLLLDDRTQQSFALYLTVRRTAAIAHAQAAVLARVEDDIEETREAFDLEVRSRRFMVPWLRRLGLTDIADYDHDALREVVRRLWTAYRRYHGTPLHLSRLSALTGTEALLLPEAYMPRWVVGGRLYQASRWNRRRVFVGNLNPLHGPAARFIVSNAAASLAVRRLPIIAQPPEPQQLTLTFGGTWTGGTVTVRGRGPQGEVLVETFALGVAATTVEAYERVDSVEKESVGTTGTVSVGLSETRRYTIVGIGPTVVDGFRIGQGAPSLPNDRRLPDEDGTFRIQLDQGATARLRTRRFPFTTSRLSDLRIQLDEGPVRTVRLPAQPYTAALFAGTVNTALGGTPAVVVGAHVVIEANRRVRLAAGPDDSATEFFRLSLTQTTASALIGDRTLNVTDVEPIYGAQNVDVELGRIDSVSGGVVADAPFVTALELDFTSDWNGGDVLVEGLDANRNLVSETFVAPVGGGRVTGSVLFRGALAVALLETGTTGSAGVRIAEGVSAYGRRVRVGRGNAVVSVGSESLTWSTTGVTSTAIVALTEDQLAASAWFRVLDGPNAGAYEILGRSAGILRLAGVFVPDVTARAWLLHARGQLVTVIGSELSGQLTLAEPLTAAVSAGVTVEPELVDLIAENGPDPDSWVDIRVDTRIGPAAAYVDLDVEGSQLPDGWLGRNIASASFDVRQGPFGDRPLLLTVNAFGDASVEFTVDNAGSYEGFPVRATFWVEHLTGIPQTFRAEVSFDRGQTYQTQSVGVPDSELTRVEVEFDRGRDEPAFVRLVWVDAPPSAVFSLHRTIIWAPIQTSYFMGSNTRVRPATDHAIIYYWHSRRGLAEENSALAESVALLPAHIAWSPFDMGEYVASDPVNVVGVYSDLELASCELEGLEVSTTLPTKHSSLTPTRPSVVQQGLSIIAPRNALLDIPADIRSLDLLPRAPGPSDILFAEDVPFFASSTTGDRAEASLGGGRLVVSTTLEGTSANTLEVALIAGASVLGADAVRDGLVVTLAADTDFNRVAFIAALINELEGYSATYDDADAGDILTAETVPFAGAPVSPWRYVADDQIELDLTLPLGREFSLEYATRMRATTPALDLGTDHEELLWFFDAPHWLRKQTTAAEYQRTQVVTFRANNRARLQVPATRGFGGTLTAFDGRAASPVSTWRYIDRRTIEFTGRLAPSTSYEFTYTARTGRREDVARIDFEARSAATEGGLATATWVRFFPGRVAFPARWWQLRAHFAGVSDLGDARLYGLGLKGVRAFTSDPYLPGVGLRIENSLG